MNDRWFTPGPWQVEPDSDERTVAETGDWFIAAKHAEYRESDENGNANLIAAAPELYQELKALLDRALDLRMLSAMDERRIRAVLSKAEGRHEGAAAVEGTKRETRVTK
jgi:hypothetical protein